MERILGDMALARTPGTLTVDDLSGMLDGDGRNHELEAGFLLSEPALAKGP
jgi:hypothetical protein